MRTVAKRFLLWFVPFLCLWIPFDHKLDKPLRHVAKALIPPSPLPPDYETALYYFPSDFFGVALFFIALYAYQKQAREVLFSHPFSRPLWMFLGLLLLSVFLSPLCHYLVPYVRALHFVPIFLACAALAAVIPLSDRTALASRSFIALTLSGVVQAAWAIAQYVLQRPLGLRQLNEHPLLTAELSRTGYLSLLEWGNPHVVTTIFRPQGSFVHPNICGGFLAATLLATSWWFLHASRGRRGIGAALILQGVGLAATFSRSAILGAALAGTVWLALYYFSPAYREQRRRLRQCAALAILSIGATLVLLSPLTAIRVRATNEPREIPGRPLTTRTALQIISERPLSGTGFSQFLAMSAPLLEGKSKYFKEPVHNIYLLIAAEAGITALAAFVWFLARAIPLRRLRDTEAITPFAIALLLLVIGMFDLYPLATHAGAWLLFLPLALLARHTPAHHRVPA